MSRLRQLGRRPETQGAGLRLGGNHKQTDVCGAELKPPVSEGDERPGPRGKQARTHRVRTQRPSRAGEAPLSRDRSEESLGERVIYASLLIF